MHAEFSLDVIDHILTYIPDFWTLGAVFTISKHIYSAFAARPQSIFKAVLQNQHPVTWPSVACLLHFKATGKVVEEAKARDIPLDRTAIAYYRIYNGDVIEFVQKFQMRYTVRHMLTDEQFNRVYRALYRLWLYQARFGAEWSGWMKTLEAAKSSTPAHIMPMPQSLAIGRALFLVGLPKDEMIDILVVFHFLQQEIMQWLCTHHIATFNDTDEMDGVVRELVAHELPDILWTMIWEHDLNPVYYDENFAEETQETKGIDVNQFLLASLPYNQEGLTYPEALILGQDHMCYSQCGLCKGTGRHLWYHELDVAGYWGSPLEFAEAFLSADASDDEDALGPFIEALESRSYYYRELIDDVLKREGINQGWESLQKLLICDRCMETLLRRHVTSCWLEQKAYWDRLEQKRREPDEDDICTIPTPVS